MPDASPVNLARVLQMLETTQSTARSLFGTETDAKVWGGTTRITVCPQFPVHQPLRFSPKDRRGRVEFRLDAKGILTIALPRGVQIDGVMLTSNESSEFGNRLTTPLRGVWDRKIPGVLPERCKGTTTLTGSVCFGRNAIIFCDTEHKSEWHMLPE